MFGIIGKKIGMTSVYDINHRYVSCTVLQIYRCIVTQIRTLELDGYVAVQIAYGDRSSCKKSIVSHIDRASAAFPANRLLEFRLKNDFDRCKLPRVGDELPFSVLQKGDLVSVRSVSKGKGFLGVVKRHGFSGVGSRTHGQHNRERAPGSIGSCSFPSRVFRGMRMAGRGGSCNVKIFNLTVVDSVEEKSIVLVSGSVAGNIGTSVVIRK